MSRVFKPPDVFIRQEMPEEIDFLVHRCNNIVAAGFGNHNAQFNLSLPSAQRDVKQRDEAVRSMEQMFPDFDPKIAIGILEVFLPRSESFEAALLRTVDHFLQVGFPKPRSNVDGASASNAAASSVADGREEQQTVREVVDLTFSDSDDSDDHSSGEAEEDQLYEEWCIYCLSREFPKIGLPSLKTALKLFQGKLDLTYKAVNLQFQLASKKKAVDSSEEGVLSDQRLRNTSWLPKGRLKLLKAPRPAKPRPLVECPRFETEWKALQSEFRKLEGFDVLNSESKGGPVSPAGIECGCCYAENLFEELVQACGLPLCLDTNGCDKTFPWSEVKRALPLDVLSKYEQRQAEDAVARAQLEGLVYCPFCNHPWEVDRGMAVLRCHNEVCKKASCIKCKEPDHLPQRCEEVEKKSETSLRRKVEELMTRALIRECTSCKAELVKIGGCNKITCRCGQMMCYVCRTPISSYSHFCQHALEPGQPCKLCGGCSLWEKENEAAVVEAAKKAAIQEVGGETGLLKRDIGPSEVEIPLKKQRVETFSRY